MSADKSNSFNARVIFILKTIELIFLKTAQNLEIFVFKAVDSQKITLRIMN
jgi:hypothetical protein